MQLIVVKASAQVIGRVVVPLVVPHGHTKGMVVGLRGLEPLTSSLSGKRSNRLSYRPVRHLQHTKTLKS